MANPQLLIAGFLAASLAAQDVVWHRDLAAAQAEATAARKDLLLAFTGSTWSVFCGELEREVLGTPEFCAGAAPRYVLVRVDIGIDEALAANAPPADGLRARFGVDDVPAVLLVDARGRPYAETGYQPGGPAQYLAHLAALQEQKAGRDANLERAAAATGLARARLLAAAIDGMGDALLARHYRAEAEEIVRLAARDDAALAHRFTDRLEVEDLRRRFLAFVAVADWDGAERHLAAVQERFAGHVPIEQQVLFYRAEVLFEGRSDFAGALLLLDEAIGKAEDSALGRRAKLFRTNLEISTKLSTRAGAAGAAAGSPPRAR